ncbi:hypothetical protein [Streptomyces sp. NPDC002176]|uniref:hypothetical protein n=1 Tax=Streptomyces sp. NPDC002176 TaxID=3364634 RepID=UPI00384DC60B
MKVQVRYRDARGAERTQPADVLRGVPVEEHPALSVPRAFRGRRSILTHWWSATTGQRVVCSTEAHMHAAMLLDFDPSVVFFGAPCLEVCWERGPQSGAVRPAFLARTAHGARLALLHPRAAGARGGHEEEAMAAAASGAGWTLRPLPSTTGVLKASLLRAASYRNPGFADPDVRPRLLDAFTRPRPLASGAAAVGGLAALSCAWHLLWTGELTWDHRLPLTPASPVWTPSKDHLA